LKIEHGLRPFVRSSQRVEMGACCASVSVAATGEVVDMMRNCKQVLFQPEIVDDMVRATGE
jgi:hypothetical protein